MVGVNLDRTLQVFSNLVINQQPRHKCSAGLSLISNLLEWEEWVFNRLDSNRLQTSINLDLALREMDFLLLLHSLFSSNQCKGLVSQAFKLLWVSNKWDSQV